MTARPFIYIDPAVERAVITDNDGVGFMFPGAGLLHTVPAAQHIVAQPAQSCDSVSPAFLRAD